ncbi:MAG: hypothetical protein Wins2KO_19930 [Winogradskyella sp.]
MSLKKGFKVFSIICFVGIVIGVIYYFNLSNRHKAIVKTRILHALNLIDSEWEKNSSVNSFTFQSPSLLIDNVYKSMEGPKAYKYFTLDDTKSELLWITGLDVSAIHNKTNTSISNDFICHMNIDIVEQEHFGRWNLLNRIGSQFPRLISLSHGIESSQFPEGYGYPIFSDESFFLTTQALNHNVTDSTFQIKHNVSIDISKSKTIKPLKPKTVFMMLPFDINNPYEIPADDMENTCIPMETKNHTYYDANGQALSGHWKILTGKQTFKTNITNQLALKDTMSLHKAIPHLHPFASQFTLVDKTSDSIIYNCFPKNHKDKIGLGATPDFTSKTGVLLYPEHEYELILKTNNTSDIDQDMMASMFLFFYDEEMDIKAKAYNNGN